MKKVQTKPKVKGKNKFIRLDDDNLKFVIKTAKEQDRSQNNYINHVITKERIKANGSSGK